MEQNNALLILSLAKKIDQIDAEIKDIRSNDKIEPKTLREQFFKIESEIKEIIYSNDIIDGIFNQETRNILRKIRDCQYTLSKESDKFNILFKKYGEDFLKFLEEKHNIAATDKEINELIIESEKSFIEDILQIIDPLEYLERKNLFGTIITNKKVNKAINEYFPTIRNCFLWGQYIAVIGLCRVLIERAFIDKFISIERRKEKIIKRLPEKSNLYQLIEQVTNDLGQKELKIQAHDIRIFSNKVLHGEPLKHQIDSSKVLDTIRKTFNIVEELYY